MKISEKLVRQLVDHSIMTAARDTMANITLVKDAIGTINEEELEGYPVELMRSAAAHLIDGFEELLEAIRPENKDKTEADAAVEAMRKKLAAA